MLFFSLEAFALTLARGGEMGRAGWPEMGRAAPCRKEGGMENKQEMQSCAIASPELQLK